MESPKLTFAALDARIEALPVSPSDTAAFPKKAKWGLFAAAGGALFGFGERSEHEAAVRPG